jgi:hypothetical protein
MPDKIINLAYSKIEELNRDLSHSKVCWRYSLGQMTEFLDCYFFNQLIDFTLCKKREDLAGAPGFTINKETLIIETVTFGELSKLEQQDREKNEIKIILEQIKSQSVQPSTLKDLFEIDSIELLNLLKSIKKEPTSNDLLNNLHSKRKNKKL